MNVSEYIVRYVEDLGIDRAYVIVGGAQLWMCKALSKSRKLKFTFTNHEQPAVESAAGYAMVSGKCGVAFVTNGPALTNTVTGMAQAYVDSTPVVLFTGNSNSHHVEFEREAGVRQYGTQDVDTAAIMKPVTKKYYFLNDPAKTAEYVTDAFHTAMSGRPGPVCIEVPINIQGAECPCAYPPVQSEVHSEGIDPSVVEEVLERLANAQRPLVFAGQGVRLSHSVELFNEFIREMDLPVVNPRMGIDCIESNNDHYVGRCGNHGDRASHFAIQTCDVMLVLGSRLAPNSTGYNVPAFSPQSFKILVEVDPAELKKYQVRIDETIEGDLHDFLEKALQILKEKKIVSHHAGWVSCTQDWKHRYPIMQEKYNTKDVINSYQMVHCISSLARENDIVIADTGSSCSVVAQVWDVKKGQRVCISGGLSGMGYWATSMGLAQGSNNNGTVICFTGDGSLQMNIHELATIRRYNIPVKLFVVSNDGYQFVRMSQSSYDINPTFGTDIEDGVPIPNTERIVKAYDLPYMFCKDPSKLEDIVKQALSMEGPVVTEIAVTKNLNVEPRLRSIANPDGSFRMPSYEDLYPHLDPETLKNELHKAFE